MKEFYSSFTFATLVINWCELQPVEQLVVPTASVNRAYEYLVLLRPATLRGIITSLQLRTKRRNILNVWRHHETFDAFTRVKCCNVHRVPALQMESVLQILVNPQGSSE